VPNGEANAIEIARLQLQVKAIEEHMLRIDRDLDRVDHTGTQMMGKVAERMAVLEENRKTMSMMLEEIRQDVKALLAFRALLFGGAAIVSIIISAAVTILGRWIAH